MITQTGLGKMEVPKQPPLCSNENFPACVYGSGKGKDTLFSDVSVHRTPVHTYKQQEVACNHTCISLHLWTRVLSYEVGEGLKQGAKKVLEKTVFAYLTQTPFCASF